MKSEKQEQKNHIEYRLRCVQDTYDEQQDVIKMLLDDRKKNNGNVDEKTHKIIDVLEHVGKELRQVIFELRYEYKTVLEEILKELE